METDKVYTTREREKKPNSDTTEQIRLNVTRATEQVFTFARPGGTVERGVFDLPHLEEILQDLLQKLGSKHPMKSIQKQGVQDLC